MVVYFISVFLRRFIAVLYQRLVGGRRIVDVLAMPVPETIEFDPPKAVIATRPADFD